MSATGKINPRAIKRIKSFIPTYSIDVLVKAIKQKNRLALARSITLVESKLQSDQVIVRKLLPKCKIKKSNTVRIGITGSPGVGKSSFIESFVQYILKEKNEARIAVLPIDPMSPLQGGSILGDKTRMQRIANLDQVFIRPSPSSLSSSINETTDKTISLCEYAGYDYILIESVGSGQSEIRINELVDFTFLLVNPATGDELQAIKKGINELAHIVIVNKDDGALQSAAKTTQSEYLTAMNKYNESKIPVVRCSSIENKGMQKIYSTLLELVDDRTSKKQWNTYRIHQKTNLIRRSLENKWLQLLHTKLNKDTIHSIRNGIIDEDQFLRKLIRSGSITKA